MLLLLRRRAAAAALLLFTALAEAASAAAVDVGEVPIMPSAIRARVSMHMAENAFFHTAGSRALVMIGTIVPSSVKGLKEQLAKAPAISTLIVDLYGGDIVSAMEIGEIIERRKMNVIVDGRCMSACANYIFPSAVQKTVLPGSLVGIHHMSVWFSHTNQTFSLASVRTYLEKRARTGELAEVNARARRSDNFFKAHRLDLRLHNDFLGYLGNRKALLGSDVIKPGAPSPANCPPVEMWALDQQQLESIGVTGIKGFWFPQPHERADLANDLGMRSDVVFFGSASALARLCTR